MSTDIANLNRLLKVLDNLIKRPGLYAINRVEDIDFIILGYNFALADVPGNSVVYKFVDDFNKFVNEWFESEKEVKWTRLIRFYSDSDHTSIDLFSNIFSHFLKAGNYLEV